MTNHIYEHLSWLPEAPPGFSRSVSTAATGVELQALAKFSLDENRLGKIANRLSYLQTNGFSLAPLVSVNIGLVSNATTKLLASALIGTALRFGISLTVEQTDYNQVAQTAFSTEAIFAGKILSVILLAIDYRGLPLTPTPGNRTAAEQNVKDCLSYVRSVIQSLRTNTGAQIILQNIAPPGETPFGSFEGRLPGTLSWLVAHLNSELDCLISDDTFILDVAGLASNVGLPNWHDPTLWNIGKLPFAQRYTPIFADYVCRILSARLGKSRRCLILDLDNTLWGGVIGDDGLNGILIGNGDPTAEAHLQVQRTALELHNRGIVLAVSSKNEDAIARIPFREHPDMLLREKHIAVFQANWSDKASNIRAIAETLSLGLESMVFLDDNPAERMQVRKELPEVAVPELPDDPALFARTLLAAGYFEAIAFSEEDQKRASFYQDNIKRVQILNQSSDMGAYLKSLEMEMTSTPFDAAGRARIVQLINKSNQFNLTTRRYSEVDVKNFQEDSSYFTRQVRLTDALGDNGMIGVIICKKNAATWEIDTWLMSCRVLGRRAEEAVLLDIVRNAKKSGALRLVGTYCPTEKNVIVKDHYNKLGFTKITGDDRSETWALDLTQYQPPELPISLKYAI
jgi:FkbH-like protein